MSTPPPILLGAALASKPGNGGHAWVVRHWLLGLRAIGYDPVLVDRLPGEDATGAERWLRRVLDEDGLRFAALGADGSTTGLDRCTLLAIARRSVGLINMMGYVDDDEILAAVPRRAFLDVDPGFGQFWWDLDLADVFAGHDAFATVGLNLDSPSCVVPSCGRRWITTVPPVVVDRWPTDAPPCRGVTTVGAWRGAYGPIEHGGQTYGLRAHELRRFAGIARLVPLRLEPALRIADEDAADRTLLTSNGWKLADPDTVAATPDDYHRWVSGSTAELCVAKQLYVRSRSGWFSDRSACYLAAGRPVLAQDTGFSAHLPVGEGLLAFDEPDDATAALTEIHADWGRHAKAARALAEDVFDATVVLPPLLAALGVAA